MILMLVVLVWSLILGWGLAQAVEPAQKPQSMSARNSAAIGTVDVIPANYRYGQQLYLENCATCHIGIPPAALPTQTWLALLQDPQHYGVELTPLVDPARHLVWSYLQTFSRQVLADENVPYRVNDSKYFKILHPKVDLPRPTTLSTCISCHPGTNQYNFRSLTAKWENSP